jgi:tetratricopeptide (TPR) repeat protein
MTQDASTQKNADRGQQLERFVSLLKLDPTNVRLRQQCIDLAMGLREFGAVIEIADIALAVLPGDAAALFDRASGFIGKREYREALQILTSLDVAPVDAYGVDFNIALCYFCLQEHDLALPKLKACYERGLRDAGLLRLLVTSCHYVGLIDEAAQVARDNPQPATTDAALAGVYALAFLDADDAGQAARWAGVALKLDPRSIEGRVVQGTLFIARVDLSRAKKMFEGVIEDAPQTARAWLGLGTMALLEQQLPTAQALLERSVELMPGHVGSWHVLGWSQLLQKNLDAASASFNKALELEKYFGESYGGLASIAALRGNREEAERLIKVALALDSESLAARFAESVLTGQPAVFFDATARLSTQETGALGKLLQRSRRK